MRILLSFVLLFLMCRCSTTNTSNNNYVESEADYLSYLETLSPWADSVEQLKGDSYFQAMSEEICHCLTKVNLGLLESKKRIKDGLMSKDSTKYYAAGIMTELATKMIISRPKGKWHKTSEITKIRSFATKKCPINFSKLDDYNKMRMKGAASDLKELLKD